MRLFPYQKATSDYNVVASGQLFCHWFYVFRLVLAVGVELDGCIIIIHICVAHPRLESSRKAKVHGKAEEMVAMLPANFRRAVTAAVIDNNIIKLRAYPAEVLNNPDDILRLVISGDNN